MVEGNTVVYLTVTMVNTLFIIVVIYFLLRQYNLVCIRIL